MALSWEIWIQICVTETGLVLFRHFGGSQVLHLNGRSLLSPLCSARSNHSCPSFSLKVLRPAAKRWEIGELFFIMIQTDFDIFYKKGKKKKNHFFKLEAAEFISK